MGRDRIPYPPEFYSALRQEQNFGCAVCGKPIITIHHIEGFKGEHRLGELILLCQDHHKRANLGLEHPGSAESISKEELYKLKQNPFNKYKVHHHFILPPSKDMVVHMGGNRFINTPIPIEIRAEPVISLRREGEQLLVSATFYDPYDVPVLLIRENVWEADTSLPDVRYSEGLRGYDAWLAIRMRDYSNYLNVQLAQGEVFIEGTFFRKGVAFDVSKDGVFTAGKSLTMVDCTFRNNLVGLSL